MTRHLVLAGLNPLDPTKETSFDPVGPGQLVSTTRDPLPELPIWDRGGSVGGNLATWQPV